MKLNRWIVELWLALAGIAVGALGCSDNCTGANCGPAPAPLEVAVIDSIAVDTSIVVDSLQHRVDTTIRRLGYISDAVVTLRRVVGGDTVVFETLAPNNGGDSVVYQRSTFGGLPADTNLVVHAERAGKSARVIGLRVKHIQGCCPYDVIGRYSLTLRNR